MIDELKEEKEIWLSIATAAIRSGSLSYEAVGRADYVLQEFKNRFYEQDENPEEEDS